MRKSAEGFSLLELLMVVAIILIISAIAIPHYTSSKQVANEAAAMVQLKTIHAAEITYESRSRVYGTIPQLIEAKVLDPRYDAPLNGYTFNVAVSDGDYAADAVPSTRTSGRYAYHISTEGVIRYATEPSRAPVGLAGALVR